MSTAGYVKLLLPPRQSRGNSHWGLDDVKTGGLPFLWDQLGGCTETAQAASGMEAARSSIGLGRNSLAQALYAGLFAPSQ